MIEKITRYFETLEGLSTEELDRSVEKLVRAEKQNVALVIMHIAEISRRKGHLERGYKNLFDYCTRRLNLSEGSVARRIQVANVSRRFPQILAALAENRMSLTVAGLLAPLLTDTNVDKLLSNCAGMGSRDVEEYLVTLRPKPVFAPSIRKAPTLPAAPLTLQTVAPEPAPLMPRPVPRVSPTILEPAEPEVFNFRFAANRAFKEKFERLAEVLGVPNPLQHMAEIMEQAMDIALDKKDLKRKHVRRLAREGGTGGLPSTRAAQETGAAPRPDRSERCEAPRQPSIEGVATTGTLLPTAKQSRARKISTHSRYISSHKRERVHQRAGYQCQYRGPDGTRCRARTGLEIEHLLPFALYRTHDEKHLRLYCGPHNRLAAEKVFGTAFFQNKIDASRRKTKAEPRRFNLALFQDS
ncbi:MAG: hypothetical protein ACRD1X_10075 [Vicinamibacteria bacterium]